MLDAIFNAIYDAYTAITDFFYNLVITIGDMLKDLGCLAFETLIDLVLLILDGLGSLFNGLNFANYFSALPSEVIYFANICSLGTCMGMIVTALTIRMLLQLIPFVRLGS